MPSIARRTPTLPRIRGACGRLSPGGPASSARTSSMRSSPAATRCTSSTISRRGSASGSRPASSFTWRDIRDPDAVFDGDPAGGGLPSRGPGGRAGVGRATRRSTPTSTCSERCGSSRPRGEAARRSSSPPPAARSTASATGRRPSRPSGARSRRTGPRSSAARSTSPRGTACTARVTSSLRLANVYGPRQEPHGEAGVVAIFMGLLHEGGTPRIYGDGSQTRDYVFVGDVVARDARGGRAMRAVSSTSAPGRRDVRASSCTPRSSARAGSRASAAFADARLGELQRSVLDISLAETRSSVGAPKLALADGLARTWAAVEQE